jgi:alkanesulfonate monooxygenase SsuD/methylene tetrahydromethanopterin reductase-like flavin-dependent oxidoreductase (luciferase family)
LDQDHIDPDRPLPDAAVPADPSSRTTDLVRRTRETGLTFRQLAGEMTGLPGGLEFTGTPEQFADLIELWVTSEAADGFTLQPTTLPGALDLFVDHVVPLLQARGLHRSEYTATTLRGHLGVPGYESARPDFGRTSTGRRTVGAGK